MGQLNIINCLLAYREILSAKRVKKFVRDRGATENTVVFLIVFSAISSPPPHRGDFVGQDSQFILIIYPTTMETCTYLITLVRHRGDFVGQDNQFI